ncbi:MAG: aldo/keto reductase [Tumebacillaceae bacterium]
MTATHISDSKILRNGVKMPWIGLGAYKAQDGDEVKRAIHSAVQAGYRSVDTASLYYNEAGVGEAIRECGVPREEMFVTTKVWNSDQGYEETLRAFETSRKKLNMDYIDLYLIHWAVKEKYKDTWRAFEKLYSEGYVRAIGTSNFQIHHLQDIMADCKVPPMVNQVELHPHLSQKVLLRFCQEQNIQMEAWSPLKRGGEMLEEPVLVELAQKYGKTAAQIILRWHLQNGVVIIPKSVNEQRIRENADLFGFELSAEEMGRMDGLNRNHRIGKDPDNFQFDF